MSKNTLKLVIKLDDGFVRLIKLLSWKYNALKWKHRESKWDYKEMRNFLTWQHKVIKWKYRELMWNYKEYKVFLALKHAERVKENKKHAAEDLQTTAVFGAILVFVVVGILTHL